MLLHLLWTLVIFVDSISLYKFPSHFIYQLTKGYKCNTLDTDLILVQNISLLVFARLENYLFSQSYGPVIIFCVQ